MFEFVARLALGAVAGGVTYGLRPELAPVVVQFAAGYLAWALFFYLLDRRKLAGVGLATCAALVDAGFIGSALAVSRQTGSLAFLSAIPLAYAVRSKRCSQSTLAPLSGAIVVASHNLLARAPLSGEIIVQALGSILVVSLASRPQYVETISPNVGEDELPAAPVQTPEADLELRESFRRLRDHSQQLDVKGRRARWAMQLFDAAHDQPGAAFSNISSVLREISGASGLTLYTVSAYHRSLIVQAASGDVASAVRITRIPIGRDVSAIIRGEGALKALADEEGHARVAQIPLRVNQRLIGMIRLSVENSDLLEEATERLEECAEFVSALVSRELEMSSLQARVGEAEILYRVSSTAIGSETSRTLLARVVRDLFSSLGVEHLSAHLLDGEETLSIASEGVPMKLIDAMSFAKGPGLIGWLGIGAPDLILTDTHQDARCPKEAALKRRIGSYVYIPIRVNDEVVGALAAGGSRMGALDDPTVETMKLVAGEIGQAMGRLEGTAPALCGLVTPSEMERVLRRDSGSLIVLDPLRKEELAREYGPEALDHCLRRFAAKARTLAPFGSLVCRRETDLVVFIPDSEEDVARNWANEAAANAAMTIVRAPNDGRVIPFGLRAKVSSYAPIDSSTDTDVEIASSFEFPA